ncbi:MAG: NAD(P)H-hydrate epimerase [Paludibaculum sp.]
MSHDEILTVPRDDRGRRGGDRGGTPGLDPDGAGGRRRRRGHPRAGRPCAGDQLCGPGNNGGDGYVVARVFAARGWPVEVEALAAPHGDASEAAADVGTEPVRPRRRALPSTGLIVDALFGAGLTRPLEGDGRGGGCATGGAVRNEIVAVDLPSGLVRRHGPSRWAKRSARADRDLPCAQAGAMCWSRAGSLCGEVVVADIGLAASAATTLFENDPALWLPRFPWPSGSGSQACARTAGRGQRRGLEHRGGAAGGAGGTADRGRAW